MRPASLRRHPNGRSVIRRSILPARRKRISPPCVPSQHSLDGNDLYRYPENAPLLAPDGRFPVLFSGSSELGGLGFPPPDRPRGSPNCLYFLLLNGTIQQPPGGRGSRPSAGLRPDVPHYQHLRLGSS